MAKSEKPNGIFSAIGAATGLGNALRFPSLCFCYGGAFVFAYVLSLVLVCFPLLSAELQLGKLYDTPLNKTLKRCAPKLSWIAYSAAINSAVIAIYYCVICAKLGGAFFAFTSSGEAGDAGGLSFYAAGALSVVAVWFIMRGKPSRIARSGALSVIGSLSVFALLAVAVLAKGAGFVGAFGFRFADLRSGGLWADALGQSLLALSLAGGVMPTFARSFDKHFSAPKTAAKIIAFNLAGCLLSAVAALGLSVPVPQGGGVTVALTLYPQVIASAVANPVLRRMFGTAFFAFLWLVSIQSACSLLSPAMGLIESKRHNFAIALSCASLTLLPVLAAKDCAAMFALDRMACSVNAVIIAFFEAFIFNYPRNMSRLTGDLSKIVTILLKLFCPIACGALALFSLCGARFSCFPLYAVAIALSALIAVFMPAILYFIKAGKEWVKKFVRRKSHIYL